MKEDVGCRVKICDPCSSLFQSTETRKLPSAVDFHGFKFSLRDYNYPTLLIVRYTDKILADEIVSRISNNRPIYLFRRRLHWGMEIRRG